MCVCFFFFPESFTVSGLRFKLLIHFGLIFGFRVNRVQFHSFACDCIVFSILTKRYPFPIVCS